MRFTITTFCNIANQQTLRFDANYRIFFDKEQGKVWDASIIPLSQILQPVISKKIKKGELPNEEYLVDMKNVERRFDSLINLESVWEIGSDKIVIQEGDIIIPKIQPRMGNIFTNLNHNKYLGSTEFIEYICKSGNYNIKYIFYLITNPQFQKCLLYAESGKTHRRVNDKDLLRYKIPNIPIDQQNAAISKIEPIEKEICLLKEQLKTTSFFVNSVFVKNFGFDIDTAIKKKNELVHHAHFEDLANEELKFDISLKYRYIFQKFIKELARNDWIVLDKVVDVKGGKRLPKGQCVIPDETEYRYIRVIDLNWSGLFDIDNIQYITNENHKAISKYIAKTDDILLTIVGATIGKCGIVPEELDGENITENFARLIIKDKNEYLPEFVNYCLISASSQIQIDEYNAGASQGKLALFRIKKILIPKININQQQSIVSEIKTEIESQNVIKTQISLKREEIDKIIEETIR